MSGQVNLDGFISHRFSLDQVEAAFQTAQAGQAIKVFTQLSLVLTVFLILVFLQVMIDIN